MCESVYGFENLTRRLSETGSARLSFSHTHICFNLDGISAFGTMLFQNKPTIMNLRISDWNVSLRTLRSLLLLQVTVITPVCS